MVRWLISLFSSGRNPIVETVEVFRENAEAGAQRDADYRQAALAQYGREFHARSNRTWLDAFADALNRLIRPVMTIATLYPLVATVRAPAAMEEVWTALATLPNGYWALLGIIIPFYFGGRMQTKALDASMFKSAATAVAGLVGKGGGGDIQTEENSALADWRNE